MLKKLTGGTIDHKVFSAVKARNKQASVRCVFSPGDVGLDRAKINYFAETWAVRKLPGKSSAPQMHRHTSRTS